MHINVRVCVLLPWAFQRNCSSVELQENKAINSGIIFEGPACTEDAFNPSCDFYSSSTAPHECVSQPHNKHQIG